jgi:hypothetical protein
MAQERRDGKKERIGLRQQITTLIAAVCRRQRLYVHYGDRDRVSDFTVAISLGRTGQVADGIRP